MHPANSGRDEPTTTQMHVGNSAPGAWQRFGAVLFFWGSDNVRVFVLCRSVPFRPGILLGFTYIFFYFKPKCHLLSVLQQIIDSEIKLNSSSVKSGGLSSPPLCTSLLRTEPMGADERRRGRKCLAAAQPLTFFFITSVCKTRGGTLQSGGCACLEPGGRLGFFRCEFFRAWIFPDTPVPGY